MTVPDYLDRATVFEALRMLGINDPMNCRSPVTVHADRVEFAYFRRDENGDVVLSQDRSGPVLVEFTIPIRHPDHDSGD